MNETIKNNGVIFGFALAAYYVITTLGIFFYDKTLFVNMYLGFTNIFVSIILGIICIIAAKRKMNGYITFKNAFTSYLLTIVIGIFAHILINYILFNIIDSSAKEVVKNLTVEFTQKNMIGLGVETETINKTIEEIRMTDNFEFGNLFKSFAWKTLLYSIAGMLIALIFRNQIETIRPLSEEMPSKEEITLDKNDFTNKKDI